MGSRRLAELKMKTIIVVLSTLNFLNSAKALSIRYGVPIAPLETIDIPEQGPGILIPESSRSLASITTPYAYNYGNAGGVSSIARPLETITIPEQGPGFLIPESSRRLASSSYDNGYYGVPIAPLETIDIPEQGPGILIPPEASRSLTSQPFTTFSNHLAPPAFAPVSASYSPVQYHYGYQIANSARQETRDLNGVTHGFYSYLDPNGIQQRVDYVADDGGYRVLGNPPVVQDTPEVARAKAEFFKAYQAALDANNAL